MSQRNMFIVQLMHGSAQYQWLTSLCLETRLTPVYKLIGSRPSYLPTPSPAMAGWSSGGRVWSEMEEVTDMTLISKS